MVEPPVAGAPPAVLAVGVARAPEAALAPAVVSVPGVPLGLAAPPEPVGLRERLTMPGFTMSKCPTVTFTRTQARRSVFYAARTGPAAERNTRNARLGRWEDRRAPWWAGTASPPARALATAAAKATS